MTKANHTTDSPWDVRPGRDGDWEIWCGPMRVATVHHAPGMFRTEAKANAELIAKAPQLWDTVERARQLAANTPSLYMDVTEEQRREVDEYMTHFAGATGYATPTSAKE